METSKCSATVYYRKLWGSCRSGYDPVAYRSLVTSLYLIETITFWQVWLLHSLQNAFFLPLSLWYKPWSCSIWEKLRTDLCRYVQKYTFTHLPSYEHTHRPTSHTQLWYRSLAAQGCTEGKDCVLVCLCVTFSGLRSVMRQRGFFSGWRHGGRNWLIWEKMKRGKGIGCAH